MKTEKSESICCREGCTPKQFQGGCNSNTIYGMGVIGALFYFLQGAATFGDFVVGIGKSLFWPAVVLYNLLSYFQI